MEMEAVAISEQASAHPSACGTHRAATASFRKIGNVFRAWRRLLCAVSRLLSTLAPCPPTRLETSVKSAGKSACATSNT